MKKICDRLLSLDFDAKWSCELRVDNLTKDTVELLKKAGCIYLQFGLESGNNEVLKAINKRITREQVEQALQWCRELDIYTKCSVIIGHHLDTESSVQETIEFIKYLKHTYRTHIGVSINTPLPGSYLYEHAGELGIKIFTEDWSEYNFNRAIIETGNLSRQSLQKYYQKATFETSDEDIYSHLERIKKQHKLDLTMDQMIDVIAANTLKAKPYGDGLTPWKPDNSGNLLFL